MAKSAQIQKMSVKHEAILNFMLANPTEALGVVAGHFGVTPAWLSTIVHSHAFQDQLARRKEQVFDSAVLQPLESKLTAAAHQTLDAYLEKIPALGPDQLISAQDKLLGRLGYGVKTNGNGAATVNVQINQVSKEILEEARNRIGTVKMGSADSPPALQNEAPEKGTEIEGTVVREGSKQ